MSEEEPQEPNETVQRGGLAESLKNPPFEEIANLLDFARYSLVKNAKTPTLH